MRFELLSSQNEYRGRNFNVRRVEIRLPDGRKSSFDIMDHNGSAIMIPLDVDGNLIFVRQYRHAVEKEILEFPAGAREADEPYEDCAAREMREETGLEAGKLQKLGEFYLAPGYSTEFMAVFLATDLKENPLKADDDEFLEVEKVPLKRAIEMAENGEILDAKSLAALMLARPFFEKDL